MSAVETRLPREEVRIGSIHTHSKGIQVPSSNSEFSSHEMNTIEGLLGKPHIPDTMPQLDRPLSISYKKKKNSTRNEKVHNNTWRKLS